MNVQELIEEVNLAHKLKNKKEEQKNFQFQIFTRGSSTVCLTENNLCYVWGDNKYGQLGLGDTNNRSIPTLLSLPIILL